MSLRTPAVLLFLAQSACTPAVVNAPHQRASLSAPANPNTATLKRCEDAQDEVQDLVHRLAVSDLDIQAPCADLPIAKAQMEIACGRDLLSSRTSHLLAGAERAETDCSIRQKSSGNEDPVANPRQII